MITDVTFPAAFLAGLISFLSPCVLPLVPPYLVYLTGATIEHVASEERAASKRAVMASAGSPAHSLEEFSWPKGIDSDTNTWCRFVGHGILQFDGTIVYTVQALCP